ncbi:MAG: leucine--tRNA ligase [Polyangiaceae bacterium]|nr:leucine--tRNA ligase [Polyangiaceae bacterium]
MSYEHKSIEKKWQNYWSEKNVFQTQRREGREKYYVLDMFPYPSGSGLHVGHPEGYTATDILARYKKMKGFDVLHPIGWDAFGLPAEQYAIQTGTHPAQTTAKNIKVFKRQLSSLGFGYDWEREINTTQTDYVRWTQWIFLQLFRKGLAFQSEIPVNWCQELGTVLANEEVIDGRSERGGYPVERRPLRQWQLKITEYADRLAADLDDLDWPETKAKQRDWIGRSEGALVRFKLEEGSELEVFTTRPDTLFGATYMVIAPDHPLTLQITAAPQLDNVEKYIQAAAKKSDLERTAAKEKTGVFTGAYAINPVNQERIPVYTADYVLGAYGTGAIMAVPAHDARDFEFARAFDLPIRQVVSSAKDGAFEDNLTEAYTSPGRAVQSGFLDGLETEAATARMIEYLQAEKAGDSQVNYKLRDWVFSRQRYWGEPIPIYFPVETEGDPRKGDAHTIDYSRPLPVPEDQLPLELPELEDYQPGDPAGALVKALDWRFFQKDGQWFARETNTMPQWAGSCWYYLRYIDPQNQEEPFSKKAYSDWMPVDLYVGGAEHAVLHLLYARFWHKVLYDCGVVADPEPFKKLVHQGMILGMVYRYYVELDSAGTVLAAEAGDNTQIVPDKERGGFSLKGTTRRFEARFLVEPEIEMVDGKPHHPELKVALAPVAEKMSKARGNVVNPDDVVAEFGADTLRIYEMFMGPLEQVKPWQTSGLQGVRRFLDKVVQATDKVKEGATLETETEKLLHRTIKKVTHDIEGMRFNTAVSTMMIYVNHLGSQTELPGDALEPFLLVLSPFAPHLAEELWSQLALKRGIPAADGSPAADPAPCIAQAAWPTWDESLCVDTVVTLPVQVNGKVRAKLEVARNADEKTVRELALANETIQGFINGKPIRKFIFVPGRICNIIAK